MEEIITFGYKPIGRVRKNTPFLSIASYIPSAYLCAKKTISYEEYTEYVFYELCTSSGLDGKNDAESNEPMSCSPN